MRYSFFFINLCSTILFFATCGSSRAQSSIQLDSGREVSLSLFNEHFPVSGVEKGKKQLYEITEDSILIGNGLNVNLHEVTGEPEHIVYEQPKSTFLDGIKIENSNEPVFLRVGHSYVVSQTEDGTVLGVWGMGISLHPLDHLNHPGIYVNNKHAEKLSHNFEAKETTNTVTEKYMQKENSLVKLDESGHKDEMEEGMLLGEFEAMNGESPPVELQNFSSTRISVSNRQSNKCKAGSRKKEVEVAVAFSSRLCSNFGNFKRTRQAIIAAMAAASRPYERQTCLVLKVISFDGYCAAASDPYREYKNIYSGTNRKQQKLLPAFSIFWNINRKKVKRDVALFLPSFIDQSSTLGVAFLGTICKRSDAYAWAEGLSPLVIAHEIGHSLNARHSKRGLMASSGKLGQKFFKFSQPSINQITSFIIGKKCLTAPTGSIPPLTLPSPQPLYPKTCGAKFRTSSQANSKSLLTNNEARMNIQNPTQRNFLSRTGFRCTRSVLPKMKWKFGALLSGSLQQKSGRFIVNINLSSLKNNRKFRLFRTLIHVSTDSSLTTLPDLRKVAKVVLFSKVRTSYSREISASRMKAPREWRSCCGKSIFVYIYAVVVSTTTPVYRGITAYRYTRPILCRTCSKKIARMSFSRACPVCKR